MQVKQVEYRGIDYNFQGTHIAVAESVIVSFSTSGPTERKGPLTTLPAPSLRLTGAQVSYLDRQLNEKVQEALNINADPTTINNELWQVIKSTYPTLTHIAVTTFNVAETYKISEEAHHLPYMWSSSIVCRTMIVDLKTRAVVSEWRQEVADRSTWTDACSAPEELATHLAPVENSSVPK